MARTRTTNKIRDVAKAAGASMSTVSRVSNDKDDVASDTYQRVQEVIQELGYTSSLAARSMRSRRTNVIGLIMPDLAAPFTIQVVRRGNQAIAEYDFDLIAYSGGSIRGPSTAERTVNLSQESCAGMHDLLFPDSVSFPVTMPEIETIKNSIPDPPFHGLRVALTEV